MRRILVDYARQHCAAKRGGTPPVDLDALVNGFDAARSAEILAVDEALHRLRSLDPQQAEIVELRYFGGLTVEETAAQLGISERTFKRDWSVALLWLRNRLAGGDPP